MIMAMCDSWQYGLNCWNPTMWDGAICDDCYRKIQTEGLKRIDFSKKAEKQIDDKKKGKK